MDRAYKAPDTVNVYPTPECKNSGQHPITQVQRVPYSMHGMENYKYKNAMYPGYVDGDHACIFLSDPLTPKGQAWLHLKT